MGARSRVQGPDGQPLAVLLMGPTAAGKTELAVELVRRLPFSIISVDSVQVYRGMDIGSAKPGPEVLAQAPHRLIDICDPRETYSAARFREDALAEMREISAQGRVPLLVGGSPLYFRALQYGLSQLPDADPKLRQELLAEGRLRGWEALHRQLAAVDPAAARRIHPNDPQRIQRALEVFCLTGHPISELQTENRPPELPVRVIKLARSPSDRGVLHQRIERRFSGMLALGFEREVRGLLERGDLSAETPALRAVGYRQMAGYLLGEYGRAEMVERGVIATRQLAKRQLTWLRGDPQIHWLDDETGHVLERALKILAEATNYG